MIMRKTLFYIVIAISFLYASNVKAANITGTVVGSDILAASGPNLTKPNNECSYKENGKYSSVYASPNLRCFDTGDKVVIHNYDSIIPSTISSCSKGFYNVTYTWQSGNSYSGYVCADNVVTNVDSSAYATEFKNSNIPSIYWDKLALLKQAHPNWKFTGYNTGLDWNTVLTEEEGSNAIQSSNPIYLSLKDYSYNASNNNYIPLEAGGWYFANTKTIGYYMDPRNFMDEKSIFMFENLNYNGTYQTIDVVNKVLSGTQLASYAQTFIDAATYNGNNVSPVMLAALSRQEVVLGNGSLSDSANGSHYLDKGAMYNFYNYGSYSSCILDDGSEGHTIQCGLMYAYKNGWVTPELAIKLGAAAISRSYINNGQNTLYFKKFNVTKNNTYSHQYQTNLKAPYSEGVESANSYAKIQGLLDSSFEFIIPVYNNMPESAATLPTAVDNKELETRKNEQTNTNLSTSITNAGYTVTGSYLMGVKIGETASSMISKIGNGVSITRDGKAISSETLGTADVLNINGNSYRIIVKGDVNGDGSVTPADYVRIKNSIMGTSSLTGSFKEAADANGDGNITPADYVNVKNYIMGNNSTLR